LDLLGVDLGLLGVDAGFGIAAVAANGVDFRGVAAFPERERRVREGEDGVGIDAGSGVDCLLVLVFLGVTLGDGRGISAVP
jgi:hypothetical protein